jgi:hypothetical protein
MSLGLDSIRQMSALTRYKMLNTSLNNTTEAPHERSNPSIYGHRALLQHEMPLSRGQREQKWLNLTLETVAGR